MPRPLLRVGFLQVGNGTDLRFILHLLMVSYTLSSGSSFGISAIASMLILRGGLLNVINDKNLNGSLPGFQFEPELLLHRSEHE
jgi:hypothetical protein